MNFDKLRHKGTILTIVSSIVNILVLLNFNVDADKIMLVVQYLLVIGSSVGIVVGAANNPETPGIDNPLK